MYFCKHTETVPCPVCRNPFQLRVIVSTPTLLAQYPHDKRAEVHNLSAFCSYCFFCAQPENYVHMPLGVDYRFVDDDKALRDYSTVQFLLQPSWVHGCVRALDSVSRGDEHGDGFYLDTGGKEVHDVLTASRRTAPESRRIKDWIQGVICGHTLHTRNIWEHVNMLRQIHTWGLDRLGDVQCSLLVSNILWTASHVRRAPMYFSLSEERHKKMLIQRARRIGFMESGLLARVVNLGRDRSVTPGSR